MCDFCSALQHAKAHCNNVQILFKCCVEVLLDETRSCTLEMCTSNPATSTYKHMQHTATHCTSAQDTATTTYKHKQHTATHCTSTQDTATTKYKHRQHTATHCNTLQHTAPLLKILQQPNTNTNKHMQHTATHCNTLQLYSRYCNNHIQTHETCSST